MPKQTPIQLHIPTPCHEDWQQMTPCERGRFCGSCQKTVVDFTGWSDKALYEFFSKQKKKVFGRFTSSQLQRKIAIPQQPHSRLYKLALACGLTLMFTQPPEADARIKPSILLTISRDGTIDKEHASPPENGGSLRGTVYNKRGKPITNTTVLLYLNGEIHSKAITDKNGIYIFEGLEPAHRYRLTLEEFRHGPEYISDVTIRTDETTIKDIVKNKKVEQVYLMGCPRF